jgi:hypothetical protein
MNIATPSMQRAGTPPADATSALERPLRAVEEQLARLATALHQQDVAAIDSTAADLHTALAAAVDHFAAAAKHGSVPSALRTRLAHASGQVAAQREALARATASLDRAMDVLIPAQGPAAGPALYAGSGESLRRSHTGAAWA